MENNHTVPAIETLEKLARALEVPLYQLFYDGEEPPQLPALLKRKPSGEDAWGSSGKHARYLNKLRRVLGNSDERAPETYSAHGAEGGTSIVAIGSDGDKAQSSDNPTTQNLAAYTGIRMHNVCGPI